MSKGNRSNRVSVAAAAALLVLGLLGGCDRLMGAEQRIERAQQRFDAGDAVAAMADVKAALERAPEDARGRALLARIALRLGDAATARKELDRALAAGADAAALRDLHYAILLAQSRFKEALQDAEGDKHLGEAQRLTVVANARMGLGQHEEASTAIDRALALVPKDRDARLMKARLLWSTGHTKEAGEAFAALAASEPEFARAALYQGGLALAVGDAKGAAEAFERARKLGGKQLDLPEQLGVEAGLAGARLALGDVDGAGQHVQFLEQRAPDAFVTRYLAGRLAHARHDYGAAVHHLQRALALEPNQPAARLLLAAVLAEQGSLEQASSELTVLVEDFPENIEARKLLARVYALRNDPAGAQRVLDEAPEGTIRDANLDWLSGSIRLMAGQTAEAIALLEQSAAAEPGNTGLRLDLVRAYLLAGRREQALTVLQALPPGEGGVQRQQLTVFAEVSGKSPAEAGQAIERLIAQHPKDASLLVVSATWLAAAGKGREAGDLFTKAVAADPRSVDARLGLAALALQNRKPQAAEELLRKVIELQPAEERAYIGLASAASLRSDAAGARQWLEKAISANPATVLPRLRLAELAYVEKDPVRARSMIDQALAVTRNRPATLNAAGQILQRAAQYEDALQRFNEAAAGGLQEAELNAAGALLALGRQDEAHARLEESVRAKPTWLAPTALLVGLDSRQKRFDAALARAAAFEKAGGGAAAADEMRGQVYAASGRQADAIAAYERAARLQPSAQLAIKLYAARRAAGSPNPHASLEEWLASHPRDPRVAVALADYHMRSGNRDAAIARYESVLELVRSPPVMNNLAWLYYESKDARAAGLARQAYEAAPQSAEIGDTYGWILVESGKTADGLELLKKAAAQSPKHPEIRYHYAAALARTGRKQEAATALRQLLDETAAFPSRGQAEALLKTL